MVEVLRVFFHTYDPELFNDAVLRFKKLGARVETSKVVPNYAYAELSPSLETEARELLKELGFEDFKVVLVKS